MRKRIVVATLICAAALFGAAAVFALPVHEPELPGSGTNGQADVRLATRGFRIGGEATRPLSPGRSAPINVRITNVHDSGLRVTRLRVWVRSVEAPRADQRLPCSRRDFAVRQVRPGFAVSVGADASRSLKGLRVARWSWPRVRMINRPVNQDGCKGASLRLAFRGSGTLSR